MLVELGRVIELIDKYNDNEVKGVLDLRKAVIKLAYPKIYPCWICGRDIYAVFEHNCYAHVDENLDAPCKETHIPIPIPKELEE